ncbi:hypothetical protein HGRIS_013817 [Hohenbuehelia grisea]|uniref:BTB domain-containing protein n=1 Tax=Hohenbuehelia grisea TaxID=104357 RepID=A0ABR3IWJ0_9AGAR
MFASLSPPLKPILKKPPVDKVSERFCAPDADLVIRSSDGVLLRVHRKNLSSFSEVFSSAAQASTATTSTQAPSFQNAVVDLPEDECTLDLLFQYMYRQRHPNLQGLRFQTLEKLAEAAEKYEVFAAMDPCSIHMILIAVISQLRVGRHPLEVFLYAMKHDYPDLADRAAPLLLAFSKKIQKETPTHVRLRWLLYMEAWNNILRTELPALLKCNSCPCAGWDRAQLRTYKKFNFEPRLLADLRWLSETSPAVSPCCLPRLSAIRVGLEEAVKQIPKFSAIKL